MKECPVCDKQQLADEVAECPQCNSDLECFQLIEELHDISTDATDATNAIEEQQAQAAQTTHVLLTQIQQNSIKHFRWLWRTIISLAGIIVLFLSISGIVFYQNVVEKKSIDDNLMRLAAKYNSIDPDIAANRLLQVLGNELDRKFADVIPRCNKAKSVAVGTNLQSVYDELVLLRQNVATIQVNLATIADMPSTVPNMVQEPENGTLSEKVAGNEISSEKVPGNEISSEKVPGNEISAEKEPQDDDFFYYQPKAKQTLWNIANKYYNNGRLYPVILELNPQLTIYSQQQYGRIKVLKTKPKAYEIYNKIVIKKDSQTLFRYQIKAGDSWETISMDFYGQPDRASFIKALNPNVKLTNGKRIVVPLP